MLNRKKGNVLIEIPIVIAIIAIVIVMSFGTIVKANKMYKLRVENRKTAVVFKGVVGELRYNANYNDLKDKVNEENTFYINRDNLNLDKIKDNNIEDLMETQLVSSDKFIEINAHKNLNLISLEIYLKGENPYNLELEERVYLSENLKL